MEKVNTLTKKINANTVNFKMLSFGLLFKVCKALVVIVLITASLNSPLHAEFNKKVKLSECIKAIEKGVRLGQMAPARRQTWNEMKNHIHNYYDFQIKTYWYFKGNFYLLMILEHVALDDELNCYRYNE